MGGWVVGVWVGWCLCWLVCLGVVWLSSGGCCLVVVWWVAACWWFRGRCCVVCLSVGLRLVYSIYIHVTAFYDIFEINQTRTLSSMARCRGAGTPAAAASHHNIRLLFGAASICSVAAASSATALQPLLPQRCPTNCSGHGECGAAGCSCFSGFSGLSCEVEAASACPSSCSGHGWCVLGKCSCDEPWSGDSCDQPSSACPMDCSGYGRCLRGRCVCDNVSVLSSPCLATTLVPAACALYHVRTPLNVPRCHRRRTSELIVHR